MSGYPASAPRIVDVGPTPVWFLLFLLTMVGLVVYFGYRMICAIPPYMDEDPNAPPPDEASMADGMQRKPTIPVKRRKPVDSSEK